eukprot:TRINITY_DN2338_c0_g1_i5.p1 TRINITY_DN2338_c0_g1~~TRINITY_DN2338_c0_g1_i5.p1  ORF type:complete len:157 (-),score=30.20 TRINITY_DN2338_c0_g1_i5:25-495(-)
MNAVHLPQAKLLLAVSMLLNSGAISAEESFRLKTMIIAKSEAEASSLVENASDEILKARVLELIGKGNHNERARDIELELELPPRTLVDPITSPVGEFLMSAKRKKGRMNALASETGKTHSEKQDSALPINHCDIGMSPQMQRLASLEQQIRYKDD